MAALAQASGKISPLQLVSWPGVFDRRLKRADFKEDRCAVVVGGDNQPLLDNRGIVSWQTAILLAHRDELGCIGPHVVEVVLGWPRAMLNKAPISAPLSAACGHAHAWPSLQRIRTAQARISAPWAHVARHAGALMP